MLTLKRVMICFLIFGCTAFCLILISSIRRGMISGQCLTNLHHYHGALSLYRADNDGHAPGFDLVAARKTGPPDFLTKYAGGKEFACPWAPSKFAMGRITAGSKHANILIPFGIEDTSVEFTCFQHLEYKKRLAFQGLSIPLASTGQAIGGHFHAVLRNGSVRSLPFDTKQEHWISNNGEFKRIEDRPSTWTGFGNTDIFDFEPKPPQFEY